MRPKISTVIRDGERSFRYICTECGAEFLRGYQLVGHMESHQEGPWWSESCPQCGQVCTHPGALSRHLATHESAWLEERFWPKVYITSECWLWIGGLDTKGYGHLLGHGRKWLQAHRVSYENMVGPIAAGLSIDHLCETKNCVRPEHLEPVTHQENIRRYHERKAARVTVNADAKGSEHGGST